MILKSLFVLFAWASAEPVTQIDQRHISPICSSTMADNSERVTLPNMHIVLEKNSNGMPVYRSNSPYLTQHVLEIIDLNIETVVVYKTFYDKKDKNLLYSLYADSGYDTHRLTHIPMPWKQEGKKPFDYKKACEMTVDAMEIIQNSEGPVLFHCTVGEDRTGMLAGLLKIQSNGYSVEKAFRDEMCARGYEAGNPTKSESPSVVNAVRAALTPLYLKMATVMKKNKGKISYDDCSKLPEAYENGLRAEDLQCESVREEMLCPVVPFEF